MTTKWIDDNPYFAGAIVMFLLGILAGIGKILIQNTSLDFGRAATASIFIAFLLGCMAVWQNSKKEDSDDESG